ncbi:hypothetical protein SAY86_028216 [Trapa natans]|uniref:Uncharacterized protein n=1 Tax=Trapa natans TaxID=22666 RepID=A0AAN7RC06_TRANT|nr:hypothetical protein SAY86_028216 [Trapa natans]
MIMNIRKRGIKIRRKLVKVFQWMTRLRRSRNLPRRSIACSGSKIFNLAKRLCSFRLTAHPYVRVGHEKNPTWINDVPKGHLAVYVGRSRDDSCRVTVPVIYFNHPLFRELLSETEKVHGYDHPGGITLPCGISEFERIQSRIAGDSRCCRPNGGGEGY